MRPTHRGDSRLALGDGALPDRILLQLTHLARSQYLQAVMLDAVTLERWIAELMDCKPLTESEVESLCDKVRRRAFAGALSSLQSRSAHRGLLMPGLCCTGQP